MSSENFNGSEINLGGAIKELESIRDDLNKQLRSP